MSQPLLSLIASISLLTLSLITLFSIANLYFKNKEISQHASQREQQVNAHKKELETQEQKLAYRHNEELSNLKRQIHNPSQTITAPEVWLTIDRKLQISLTSLRIRNAEQPKKRIDVPNLQYRLLLSLCGIELADYQKRTPPSMVTISQKGIKLDFHTTRSIITAMWGSSTDDKSRNGPFNTELSRLRATLDEVDDSRLREDGYIVKDERGTRLKLNPLPSLYLPTSPVQRPNIEK